jgi:hypothetical protein
MSAKESDEEIGQNLANQTAKATEETSKQIAA